MDRLRETENTLDRLCRAMKENYRQARKSPANEYFAYVTRDDLIDVFGEESVILTVRNFDTVREGKTKEEENETDVEKNTLRVSGLWKTVDVRLVTTDGEILHRTPPNTDDSEIDTNNKLQSSSQPVAGNVERKRRPGRRRKRDRSNIKEEESTETDEQIVSVSSSTDNAEDSETAERRSMAKSLLGYRPPVKQLKRNLDDESDSFECRYKPFSFLLIKIV